MVAVGTDSLAYFKSRPYDCIDLNSRRGLGAPPVQSYVEYSLNPPCYVSSLGLLVMTYNATRYSPTQDSTITIFDATLTYADGDTAFRVLQVGTNVRNLKCGINPCYPFFCAAYPLMCAKPADPLSREVYADATYKFDALEVPFRKAEPKYSKRVNRVRVSSDAILHVCGGVCPYSSGMVLSGLSTWPNFAVKNASGDTVERKSQFTNVDHGGYMVGGTLVGTRRLMNRTACQVASQAMAYTYAGFNCTPADLNTYLQQNKGYVPDDVAFVTYVSPLGDAIRYTATGKTKLIVGDKFLVEHGKYSNPLATYQVTVAGRNGQASRFGAPYSPTIPSVRDTGRVYWKMKPRVADGLTQSPHLESHDLYDSPQLGAQVESLLVRDIAVELNVPGHFVVASGWTSSFRPDGTARGTYFIKDPFDDRDYTKLIEGKYANKFTMARYVVPAGTLEAAGVAATDPPGLGILASGARRIEVIDPLGRHMLRDASTGEGVYDIPDASIEDVSSEHDNGGDVDDPLTGYDVEIPTTVDGHYTVNVYADDGLSMSASGYTSAGIFASDDAVDTTAAPIGATYDILYSGAAQSVTMTRTGSLGVGPAIPPGPGLLRVRQSPTTGPVEFVLTGKQVDGEAIDVFDISGRRVDAVQVAGGTGTQIVPWNWQSAGCRPGVYLARLRSRPSEMTRFVVLH